MAVEAATAFKGVAKRPRNSWSLAITDVMGVYQMNIFYKSTRGDIGPYSQSPKSTKVKLPFGPPVMCEYSLQQGVDGAVGEFVFMNKIKQRGVFPETCLNNLETGISAFSRMITKLCVEKRRSLLSKYLSLLQHSENFIHHHEEFHTTDGTLLDGTGIQEEDLKTDGGTIEEYRDILIMARESAKAATSVEKGLQDISRFFELKGKKRKAKDGSVGTLRLSKQARIDLDEKKEVEDDTGLEANFKNSYVGLFRVKLANIKVPDDMKSIISANRVQTIMASIRKWYDPSLSVFVICPENEKDVVTHENVNSVSFIAVQKLHTLLALQELEKTGELSKLPGHKSKTVFCYVLNTSTPTMSFYGNMRSNEIASQFGRHTRAQDLLHYFQCLALKVAKADSVKVCERMAKICRIGPDVCTSLRRLCEWSDAGFSKLMEVMEMFEKYGTCDVKPRGHKEELRRGGNMTMSDVIFKLLGKCNEQYFLENCQKVLDTSVSLKQILDDFQEKCKIEKVCGVLSVIAGYKSYEKIKEEYPGRFEIARMKMYIGAECGGERGKEQARKLSKYYNSVVSSEDDSQEVKFLVAPDMRVVLNDEDISNKHDTIVVLMKYFKKELCSDLINRIIRSVKPMHAILLVLPSEKDHFQVISHLRNQSVDMIEDFKIIPIVFNKTIDTADDVHENLTHGILFGKFVILNPPLKVYYRNIADLISIVDCISPQQSSLAMVCDPGVECIQLHKEGRKVTYFGPKSVIQKFQRRLDAPLSSNEGSEHDPSTLHKTPERPSSSKPSKPNNSEAKSKKKLDDESSPGDGLNKKIDEEEGEESEESEESDSGDNSDLDYMDHVSDGQYVDSTSPLKFQSHDSEANPLKLKAVGTPEASTSPVKNKKDLSLNDSGFSTA